MKKTKLIRIVNIGVALGLQDVKDKYIRSVFGPFWNTAAIAVIVLAIGPLYGKIFGGYSEQYILYLAAGLVGWFHISTMMTEATAAFTSQTAYILQNDLPIPTHVIRVVARNTFLLVHNLLIPIFIAIFLGYMEYKILFLPMIVVVVALLFIPISHIIAILSTRYRDIGYLIGTLTQFAMFLTPVFWVPNESLIRNSAYVIYNPFYYLIDTFRYSFGIEGAEMHIGFLMICFVILTVLSLILARKMNKKIVYWL